MPKKDNNGIITIKNYQFKINPKGMPDITEDPYKELSKNDTRALSLKDAAKQLFGRYKPNKNEIDQVSPLYENKKKIVQLLIDIRNLKFKLGEKQNNSTLVELSFQYRNKVEILSKSCEEFINSPQFDETQPNIKNKGLDVAAFFSSSERHFFVIERCLVLFYLEPGNEANLNDIISYIFDFDRMEQELNKDNRKISSDNSPLISNQNKNNELDDSGYWEHDNNGSNLFFSSNLSSNTSDNQSLERKEIQNQHLELQTDIDKSDNKEIASNPQKRHEKFKKQFQPMQIDIEALKASLKELTTSFQQASQALQEKNIEVENLKVERLNLTKELDKRNEAIGVLKTALHALHNKSQVLENRFKNTENVFLKQNNAFHYANTDNLEKQKEIKSLKDEKENLENLITQFKNQINDLNAQNTQLIQQVEIVQKQKSTLKENLASNKLINVLLENPSKIEKNPTNKQLVNPFFKKP